jgi:hypothetical protein
MSAPTYPVGCSVNGEREQNASRVVGDRCRAIRSRAEREEKRERERPGLLSARLEPRITAARRRGDLTGRHSTWPRRFTD